MSRKIMNGMNIFFAIPHNILAHYLRRPGGLFHGILAQYSRYAPYCAGQN